MNKHIVAACGTVLLISSLFYSFRKADPPGKPTPWKTGVALYSFNKFSFEQSLDKADSAGAKYIESFFFHNLGKDFDGHAIPNLSDEEMAKMKGMIKARGLQMKSLYAGNGKTAKEWEANFIFAQKAGIEFLSCEPDKKDWDLIDSLAGKYKVKIAIHEHGKGSSQYWHPDSVIAAMKGRPNIGVCADLGHWARSGLDPVKCLQMLTGKILAVHIKDIDTFDNLKAKDVVVGTGVLDYPAIIKELNRQNFAGIAYVEREANWEHNVPDVRHALGYLERLRR
jgi:sugar phosphate isomerase/epimerase